MNKGVYFISMMTELVHWIKVISVNSVNSYLIPKMWHLGSLFFSTTTKKNTETKAMVKQWDIERVLARSSKGSYL